MALEYTYDNQGNLQLTPDILNRRRALALGLIKQGVDTSPVQHWTQGAARLANTLVGGLQLRGADREESRMRSQDAASLSEGINAYLQSQRARTTPSQADSTTMPSGTLGANEEPGSRHAENPVADVPFSSDMLKRDYAGPIPEGSQWSPQDRDQMIRTAAFEAPPGPGQQAVAESILNRTKARGISPAEVVHQPHQYEPWATKPDEMNALDPNSPTYRTAGNAVDQALHGGDDITGGAVNFLSPGVMADRGQPLPSWASGPGLDIGGNRFFTEGQQKVASAMQPNRLAPPDAPEAIGAPTNIAPPAQQPQAAAPTQVAQDQQPTGIPAVDSGQVSREEAVNKLMQVLNSPSATDQQRATAGALLTKIISPTRPTWGVIAKDANGNEVYGWINSETQTVTPGGPAGTGAQQTGPNRSLKSTSDLRKEIADLPSYKSMAQALPVYKAMIGASASDDRAADLQMIYALGKLFDPNSVVREGELGLVMATGQLPPSFQNMISMFNASGRLTPTVRQQLMREGEIRMRTYKDAFDNDARQYQGIAQRYNFDPTDIIPTFGEMPGIPNILGAPATTGGNIGGLNFTPVPKGALGR